jgi:hypothetical protein
MLLPPPRSNQILIICFHLLLPASTAAPQLPFHMQLLSFAAASTAQLSIKPKSAENPSIILLLSPPSHSQLNQSPLKNFSIALLLPPPSRSQQNQNLSSCAAAATTSFSQIKVH